MARSPLSKKKTIPRNENNTPNPVNPSPISVSFETQGLEKVSTVDQCWNIWKEGEKSICHSLQSTPINYAHSIDSGKVKQSRWPKCPHKLIQHACRIENRAQKIYSTLWAPKPVNMVVRCMLWDPQWSWLHHYLRSFWGLRLKAHIRVMHSQNELGLKSEALTNIQGIHHKARLGTKLSLVQVWGVACIWDAS